MKLAHIATLLFLLAFCSLGRANGQSPSQVMDDIGAVLVSGNTDQLTAYLGERVEITLTGTRKGYSKTQAKYVLGQFLAENPSASFRFVHKGESAGTYYALAEYRSANGTYDVNIYLRLSGPNSTLTEIHFEAR